MQTIGDSYRRTALADHWDVIVIGSGMGGMTAAALLARHAGKRVLVLERHYTAGGYTHVFHRPGYEWDVGVHYIGEVHQANSALRAAFDHLTDGRLQWAAMPDVYDRVLMGGREYDFVSGKERFRDKLVSYFPQESDAIDRYLHAVQSCERRSNAYFADKAIPAAASYVAGAMLRAPFLRWAQRTTADVLSEFTSNRELIGVLTAQWGNYGLPPGQSSFGVHAIIANHYLNGAAYPVGGAASIAASILPTIEGAGGRLVIDAEVSEIVLDGRGAACGVRMKDGRELRATMVISDTGAVNTFNALLPPQVSAVDAARKELKRVAPSMAYLTLYVGLKETARELRLNGTNLWIHASSDHDADLRRFYADPTGPSPLLFISFPSAKDPSFEQHYPGRSTIEVVAPASFEWFARWSDSRWKHRGKEYDELKARLTERLRGELERHVPAVRGKIDCCELSTPLSTRHFTNYKNGEAYGIAATPERFRLRCLRSQTPVRNLYLTGQDVALLGVAGAMAGGILTASAVLKRNLMSAVMRPRELRAAS